MSLKKISQTILLLFCLLSFHVGYGQIIITVAGGVIGHGGYWGDGGPADSAQLGIFGGLAVDKLGNIYIADANNERIRKVDVITGIITTVAGTGVAGYNGDGILATTAKLNGPALVCVDSIGNFYIGDALNYRIRKVDVATGIITTFAGNGTLGYSGDSGLATLADCDFQAFTFDIYGNMIVEASRDHRIRKIDPSGIITTIAGTGAPGNLGDGGLASVATMSPNALEICTDLFGNIYFSDSFNSVRKINVSTGIITRVAGTGAHISYPYSGDGGLATTTVIDPLGTTVDDSGNLYIADGSNSRIEKVDTFGIIHTIAGNGTNGFSGDGSIATMAQIHDPRNVTLDICNNIYIADYANARVRKVTYPPTPITLTNAITGSNADTLCGAMTVTFTATAAASSGTVTYQWYVNGSALSTTGSTYTYTPANGDSIRCVATATNACTAAIASSNTINMVVNTVTTPTITITAPAAAAAGSLVSVNATVAGPASYSIRWYNNGVLFNTTTVPMVTYTKGAGVDNITATVVASEGCYDSSMSAVAIVTATTETSPSFGSAQDRLEVLRTYPNPVHNLLYVAIPNSPLGRPGEISYRLMSMVGSVMREGVLKEGDNMMWVEQIPVGVYMLEVVDGDGGKTVRKIVKE